jgi:cytohesin
MKRIFITAAICFTALSVQAQNKDLNKKLFKAIEKSSIENVKAALSEGADIEARDNLKYTPLLSACLKDNIEIIKLLIEKGADVKARSMFQSTPLINASYRGNIKVINLLISKGRMCAIRTNTAIRRFQQQ